MPRNSETADGLEARTTRTDILVIDDFFPNLTTGFRVAEYTHYLRALPDLLVTSTIGDFNERHLAFAKAYPDLQGRVVAFDRALLSRARLGYFNFVNNAHCHIEQLEQAALPFAFTLYPGGGFGLEGGESELKLRRVLRSPMLRAVISTQSITTEFLGKVACPVPVHELYGATIDPTFLYSLDTRPKVIRASGAKLTVCFVAHKYDPAGRTKGYPVFIEVARRLAARLPDVAFSVVGNYGPADIAIPEELGSRLQFKGLLASRQLREFLRTQDLMISPNQPFTITGSVFDGFPTASAIEASLCGVAIVCSDELDLNRFYDPDEMIVCAPDPAAILTAMEPLLRNPRGVAEMGARGRQKSRLLFSAEAQLLPRTRILRDLVNAEAS